MSWFKRMKKPALPEASRLGVRSQTVLAKLGFDLRGYYEDLKSPPSVSCLPAGVFMTVLGHPTPRRSGLHLLPRPP